LVIPILTVFISLTNNFHHLLFSAYAMERGEYYLRVSWQPGIWFMALGAYSYAIVFGLVYLLMSWVGRTKKLPRWRGLLILATSVMITAAYTLDTFGYALAPGILNLPIGLAIMNLAYITGVWYLNLFDVLPVARETLTHYMSDGIFVVDANNIVLEANPAGAQLIDPSISQIIGSDITKFMTREDRAKQTAEILKGEFHGVLPLDIRGQDRFFDILVTNIYVEKDLLAAKLIVLRDITQLTQLQEQDRQRVALEERQRIARDLHDAVSQTLFSARVTSEVLLRQKDKVVLQTKFWKHVEHLDLLVKSALGEMRILLLELRPENLINADLPALLAHLVDAAASRIDAEINLDIQGKEQTPVDVKIAFYRIAQESLNNMIKHADSTKINICLTSSRDFVKIIAEDNGVGLRRGKSSGASMGIKIMRERANEIGAKLEISSKPKQGTRVTCTWQRKENIK
jgi:PAS domain S-box-containing protein